MNYAQKTRAVLQQRDIMSACRHFGASHRAMLDRKQAWLATLPKSTTRIDRAYLEGMWDQMMEENYRYHLVHGGLYNGTFYSTHSNRHDYYGLYNIDAADFADDGKVTARGHYWSESRKPFFIGE